MTPPYNKNCLETELCLVIFSSGGFLSFIFRMQNFVPHFFVPRFCVLGALFNVSKK